MSRYNEEEDVNQVTAANMDDKKIKISSNINIPNVPATPPPTPTNSVSPSLTGRRSTICLSSGTMSGMKYTGQRVPDVIDSIGRRRSTSCCENVSESRESSATTNGRMDSIKKSNSFFGGGDRKVLFNLEGTSEVVTVTDAKPTNTAVSGTKMEITAEKEVIARMVVEMDSEVYNMNHPRRGYFIILNHDKFDSPGMDRPGSKLDAQELFETATFLGFEPKLYDNMTLEEIRDLIDQVATMDHTNADCLAIAVLTHGHVGGYLHCKDALYQVDKLWNPFVSNSCPSLAGKPKLFFIQACRGERLDGGTVLRRTETDSGVNSYRIPTTADFLISYSTVDGYYSWRNPQDGTWFIRSLCSELRRLVPEGKDLLKIMTRVHAKVAYCYQSFDDKDPRYNEKKQTPSFVCMLTRDLYFPMKS